MGRKEFISKKPYETCEFGEAIGRELFLGDLILVTGDLGSGKTQLIKGIAKGLGVKDWIYVMSPSFTLINVYEGGKFPLFHVDLYRIRESEIDDLFIEEMLDQGVVVIEWADKARWDKYKLKITLEIMGEEERRIVVENGLKF
jgi:tRNA threonylcarbamoyladenosine biosynthesis protein TsaE